MTPLRSRRGQAGARRQQSARGLRHGPGLRQAEPRRRYSTRTYRATPSPARPSPGSVTTMCNGRMVQDGCPGSVGWSTRRRLFRSRGRYPTRPPSSCGPDIERRERERRHHDQPAVTLRRNAVLARSRSRSCSARLRLSAGAEMTTESEVGGASGADARTRRDRRATRRPGPARLPGPERDGRRRRPGALREAWKSAATPYVDANGDTAKPRRHRRGLGRYAAQRRREGHVLQRRRRHDQRL